MTSPAREGDRGPTRIASVAGWFALALVVFVVLGVLATRFVASEHTLYHADQVAYWEFSRGLAERLGSEPWAAAQEVAWSVAHADLNLLPAVPIAVTMLAVGDSRATYVAAVMAIYGLGVVAMLLVAVRWGSPDGFRPPAWTAIAATLATVLLFPALWRPVFLGYLGLGGVALGLVIFTLYFRADPATVRWQQLVLIGFLTAMVALFRRWYGFWAVAFCAILVLDLVWRWWGGRPSHRRDLWRAVRAPLIVGVTCGATLILLAAPLLVDRLAPGYAQEFAAYARSTGVAGRMTELVREFGLLALALTAASVVFLSRRRTTLRAGALVPLQMALTYLLMVRLQGHGPHHWYLYLAGALFLVGLAAVRWVSHLEPARARAAAVGAMVGAGLLVTGSVYAEWLRPVADLMGPLAPRHRVRPLQRHDIAEVQRLLGFLDDRVALREGYIYVLGSTGTLSDQSLAFANRSLGTDFRSPPFILQSAHVDRRDGFPSMLLEATYVVVPQPAQTDMVAREQQVVVVPTDSFIRGENLARAFRRLPVEFLLEGDVRVWVFERERNITAGEVAELSASLRSVYPDRPDIWRP
jgi:MFS family permease